MKIREEVRRILDALGREIRTKVGGHNCSTLKGPFGCFVCETTRTRDLVLASLAYLRKKQVMSCLDLFLNELELIELLGRDKVLRKMKYQVDLLKICPRKMCTSCNTELAIPVSSKLIGKGITCMRNLYPEYDLLTAPCKNCGAYVWFSMDEFPKEEVNFETTDAEKILKYRGIIKNWFVLRRSKDVNADRFENDEDLQREDRGDPLDDDDDLAF